MFLSEPAWALEPVGKWWPTCLRGQRQPVMGSALLAEYEAVLGRATLFAQSRLNAAERDELLDIFIATCQWQRIYYGWRPNVADEADNHLFELAVAAGAAVIVSRNIKDFAWASCAFPTFRCKPQSIF